MAEPRHDAVSDDRLPSVDEMKRRYKARREWGDQPLPSKQTWGEAYRILAQKFSEAQEDIAILLYPEEFIEQPSDDGPSDGSEVREGDGGSTRLVRESGSGSVSPSPTHERVHACGALDSQGRCVECGEPFRVAACHDTGDGFSPPVTEREHECYRQGYNAGVTRMVDDERAGADPVSPPSTGKVAAPDAGPLESGSFGRVGSSPTTGEVPASAHDVPTDAAAPVRPCESEACPGKPHSWVGQFGEPESASRTCQTFWCEGRTPTLLLAEARAALVLCVEAFAKHDEWCGHNAKAPGNSIWSRAWGAAQNVLDRESR